MHAEAVEFGLLIRDVGNPAEQATAAERLGFDFLATGEHVSFTSPTPNALMCLAAAAAVTGKLGLMTAITLAPVYPPPLLAKMGAYLDHLSGGRLELGIGIGGENPQELIACGVAMSERGDRTSELIQVMRRLWSSEGPTSFSGRYSTFEGISIDPRPLSGDIPIWISGRSDAAIRRAIAFECDWLPYMYSPRKLAASLDRFAELGDHLPRAGVVLWIAVDGDPARARSMALRSLRKNFGHDFESIVDSVCLVGTPGQVTDRLREYVSAGARRLLLTPCTETPDELEAMLDTIADAILPLNYGCEFAAHRAASPGGTEK